MPTKVTARGDRYPFIATLIPDVRIKLDSDGTELSLHKNKLETEANIFELINFIFKSTHNTFQLVFIAHKYPNIEQNTNTHEDESHNYDGVDIVKNWMYKNFLNI